MKKIFAAFTAILMMGAAAFAEGYINAADLDKGSFTADIKCEDGFVIHANSEKNVEIKSADARTVGEDTFTQCIKLGGAGKLDYRSISFPAKAGETVTVQGVSSSKTEARAALVVNEAGETVAELPLKADGADVSTETFKAPADGTYYVWSKKSGIYIFQIKVGK